MIDRLGRDIKSNDYTWFAYRGGHMEPICGFGEVKALYDGVTETTILRPIRTTIQSAMFGGGSGYIKITRMPHHFVILNHWLSDLFMYLMVDFEAENPTILSMNDNPYNDPVDALGRPLRLGDQVITLTKWGTAGALEIGIICAFSPAFMTVRWCDNRGSVQHFDQAQPCSTIRYP